jgi:hypothetical protein
MQPAVFTGRSLHSGMERSENKTDYISLALPEGEISMTTIFSSDVRCAVCGQESHVSQIGSTNSFGSPDLDTRPPEMKRSTIWAWVSCCPGCGYCASDLAEDVGELNAIVHSPDYQARLKDERCPAKANEFLCQALIAKHLGRLQDAVWATLHATWICDDSAEHAQQAIECRKAALALLLEAERAGDPMFDEPAGSGAMRVDLLRRSGDFPAARAAVDSMIVGADESIIRSILVFQKHLIETGDAAAHLVSEAVDFVEKKGKRQ